jgi:hypothetical protein
MRIWWTTLNAFALTLAVGLGAHAAEGQGSKEKAEKTGVSRILKKLDWKISATVVLDDAKRVIEERYSKKVAKHSDAMTVDRIMREKRAAFAEIKKSLVFFDGGRSGYEASVVADEFRANQGESMFRIDDNQAQRYYFFQNDRLWKIVVVYNSSISRKVDFPAFIKQIKGTYGQPVKMDWHTPAGGTRTLRGVTWADEITHLDVEDRREFFGTYLMRFVDKADGLALEKRRKGGAGVAAPGGDFTDGMMADIMGDGGGEDSANVVDELTGSQHDVDLITGRPKDDTIVLDRSGNDAVKAKTRKKKASKRKGSSKTDSAPAQSDEPYIIY